MFTRCAFSVRFAPIFKSAVLSFSVIKLDTNLKKPNEWGSLKSEFGPKLSTISKDLKPVTVGKDSVLNLLWKYLKKEWFLVTSIVVITAVNSALAVSLPSLISKLMYSINLVNATKLFSVFLLRSIVMVFNTQLLFALGERMAFDLKRDLFRAIIVRDLEWFDGRFEHDILSRLESDTIELKHNIKQFIAIGLRSVFEITGSVITLFYINFKLSLILTMYLPIVYAALSVYGFHLRALSKKCKLIEQSSGNTSSQTIQNIKIVRSFQGEQVEMEKYTNALLESKKWNNHLGFHLSLFQGLVQSTIAAMILSILFLGGNMVLDGKMTGEELLHYFTTTQASQKAFDNLGIMFGQAVKIHGITTRLTEYINYDNHIPFQGGIRPIEFKGNIEFVNASFVYPSRPDHPVLNNFNLEIPAGKVLAVCGQSGSGKSTLGQLIERFYDLDGGKLLVDGYDISTLDPCWLRNHIAYITQEPTLFATTILENIRYGAIDASDEQVMEAAKLANALDFIQDFPDGFNTVVGERGATLSGGQKQRIAIARAILKDPQFLILDEATSALDTKSEVLVQSALEKLMKGRTVLVIAHRLSTIEKADMIVVMGNPEAGGVLEKGTHQQLMARGGHYSNLYYL